MHMLASLLQDVSVRQCFVLHKCDKMPYDILHNAWNLPTRSAVECQKSLDRGPDKWRRKQSRNKHKSYYTVSGTATFQRMAYARAPALMRRFRFRIPLGIPSHTGSRGRYLYLSSLAPFDAVL